jgi:hypothetical protein
MTTAILLKPQKWCLSGLCGSKWCFEERNRVYSAALFFKKYSGEKMLRKLPIILTVIYLFLVLLSIIPIFTGDDALSGILAIVLTVPWSSILSSLLPGPGSVAIGLLVVAVGAAINAAIIYFVSRWVVNRLVK